MAAIAGRFVERLVAALLARANLHCVAVRLFSFRGREAAPRPRPQKYHAQASSVVVPKPWRHRADTCAHASRQASALFRLRPMTDLPALPPLHSTPRPLKMKQAPLHSFRRPQTGKTVKNSSGAPKETQGRDAPHIGQAPNMAARLRPARTPAIRREALPIAEDISINREHGACCSCVAKHAVLTEGGHPLGCLRLRRHAAIRRSSQP